MKNRKAIPVEQYMKAGAMFRLTKELLMKLYAEKSPFFSAADRRRFDKALKAVNEVCSAADGRMFKEHPELSNDYLDVFYGDLDHEPRNTVDAGVIEMAREALDELFRKAD